MKNNIKFIFLALILLSGTAFSQVGINTKNPQGVFNIDGGKDNPETGNAHTAEQQLNDLTVLANGNMGLGTINPSHKVHIVTGGDATTPVRGFKLTDGNEGDQRVLATISGAGIGTWKKLDAAKNLVEGDFSAGSHITSDNSGGAKYSGAKITLTPGVWIVNLGMTFYYPTTGAGGTYENPYWLHVYLSTSTTTNTKAGYTPLGPSGGNSGYAGVILKTTDPGSPNFLFGSMVIRVNGTDPREIYVLIENKSLVSPATGGSMWGYDNSSWENYLYAIPVNE